MISSPRSQAGIESAGSESQQLFDLANEIEKARKAYLDAMGSDTLAVAEKRAFEQLLWDDKGTIAYAVRIAAESLRAPCAGDVDLTNHHNALKCPYCNPEGLQFAPSCAGDREGIARIIDPNFPFWEFAVPNSFQQKRKNRALAKADVILALSHSPACGVREALEPFIKAAKVIAARPQDYENRIAMVGGLTDACDLTKDHFAKLLAALTSDSAAGVRGEATQRETIARAWLRGIWFDGDAAAFEAMGDHPEWLAALKGADALIAGAIVPPRSDARCQNCTPETCSYIKGGYGQCGTPTEQDYLEDNIGTVAFHLGRPGARLSIAYDGGPKLIVDPGEVLKEISRRLTLAVSSAQPLPPDWKQDQAETSRLAPRVPSTDRGGGK